LLHRKRIGRTFALAAKAVTKEQFLRFLPRFSHGEMRRYPDPTCPIAGVTWYEAAAYCNWLSQQEGIPEDQWCYETIPALPVLGASTLGLTDSAHGQGPLLAASALITGRAMNPQGQVVRLKANYLSLTGYRLPTAAEWEYACRVEAVTTRYYGESEELLKEYAWYALNAKERTWPVGSKRPNDLGLFDMHGNVYTWCQERYQDYLRTQGSEAIEDKEDILDIKESDSRVLRGGSFYMPASDVRSADRITCVPAVRLYNAGFRPARTFR
jgi:formylglycine-generating enzyme required for sulfatase activity